MIEARFTDMQGNERVFSAEGFEVSTTDIYSTRDGKRCAGFQAEWDAGARVWHVYGQGNFNGASFAADDGVELSVGAHKPVYSGYTSVAVYGAQVNGHSGLVAYVHDGSGQNAGADPWGWLEQKRWQQGRGSEGQRGSLSIQPLGTYRPRTRNSLAAAPVSEPRSEPRTRLSALAERLAA